mgnify:CR=1 FL=1
MSDGAIRLVDVQGNRLADPTIVKGEVILPGDLTWVWCLDARHEPYPELELSEVLKRAATNRKRYVLVNATQLGEAPEEGAED